jgi:hypothetical protein
VQAQTSYGHPACPDCGLPLPFPPEIVIWGGPQAPIPEQDLADGILPGLIKSCTTTCANGHAFSAREYEASLEGGSVYRGLQYLASTAP